MEGNSEVVGKTLWLEVGEVDTVGTTSSEVGSLVGFNIGELLGLVDIDGLVLGIWLAKEGCCVENDGL